MIQNRIFALAALMALIVSSTHAIKPAPRNSAKAADSNSSVTVNSTFTESESYLRPPENRPVGLQQIPADVIQASATANVSTAPLAFDESTMMRVKDLRPGMKGYGLTVFSGIRPEKFEAEVVGVRHRAFPGDDMILCMLKSPYLQDIGVIAGMSGSPVYINGKLIGAVAYGWTFAKEPLAGVTPIESMLQVYNSTSSDLKDADDADGNTFTAYNAYTQMYQSLQVRPVADTAGAKPVEIPSGTLSAQFRAEYQPPATVTMEPLSTPLFISSASKHTISLARELFAGQDIQPIAMAVGGGAGGYPEGENSPGGSVKDLKALANEMTGGYGLAIPLLEGDLSMAGVGTVSFRQGNKLVAFGHPMFENGVVNYPMAPARINALVRNLERPFKLGEPLGQVGIVKQDRLPAIGAVFGPTARMFPISATVVDNQYRGTRQYHFRAWDDREYGPMLVMLSLSESMSAGSRGGGQTVSLYEYSASFDDGTTFTKQDYEVDDFGGGMIPMELGSEVGMIMTNPYKRVHPESVEFHVQIADRFPQAKVRTATLDRAAYHPGDTVHVQIELEPYRRHIENLEYAFRLPSTMLEGDYELTVCDSYGRETLENRRNPGGDHVISYETLLESLRRNYPRNKVYLVMQDSDTGISVRGNELPKLPSSVINTIESTGENAFVAPVRGNVLVDSDLVTQYEVSGTKSLTVTVSRDKL